MTVYNQFSPHLNNTPLANVAGGARGYAVAYTLAEVIGQRFVAALTWEHVKSSGQDPEIFAFMAHIDGELRQTVVEQTMAHVGQMLPDIPYAVEVFPISLVEMSQLLDSLGEAYVAPRGARVRLTLDKPTGNSADFYSYEVYYDAGDEDGVTDTLLRANKGIDANIMASGELEDKNYTFKQKYTDRLGNVSALGAGSAIDVLPVPLAPDTPALAYSSGTQKVTLTAQVPAGQYSNVIGYVIYSNWLPGQDLRGGLIENDWSRLGFATVAGSDITFTTFMLWTGAWRFAIKAITGLGVESGFTELKVNLADGGGGLDEIADQPERPNYIAAVPLAAGDIAVTVWHDGVDSDGLKLYRDGALVATYASAGVTSHVFTDTGLVDATEYDYTAKAYNGTVLSDASDEVSATSDSAAPTGPLGVALELSH